MKNIIIDYNKLIDTFYPEKDALRSLLIHHSRQVAQRCLAIAGHHPELHLDTRFMENAAMLHDIGIIRCDAPGIHCHGTAPYIRHGVIGGEMLRNYATISRHPHLYDSYARVCERHTSTGLTLQQIESRNLPLPHQDLTPETMEEQVICYADKFYSKSHPERERSVEEAAASLEKFGHEGVEKFLTWAKMFE